MSCFRFLSLPSCSNRLGIRMEGPKPRFARPDGGEGGSHPSNVHDHVYAIGTINYTGDMPIALMVRQHWAPVAPPLPQA